MKITSATLLLLALPVLSRPAYSQATPPPPTTAPAAAPDAAPAAPAVAPAAPEDKDTDLEVQMKRMNKAFKKLKRQVADPTQNAASLDLVATMDDATKIAMDLTPKKADDVAPDQKAKFIEDYKAGMKGMQDELAKLSEALTAGKNDDAVKIVADMFDLEKKDHKDFRKPEKN